MGWLSRIETIVGGETKEGQGEGKVRERGAWQ